MSGRCVEYVGRGAPCGDRQRCVDLDHPLEPDPEAYDGPRARATLNPLIPDQSYAMLICDDGICTDRFGSGHACTGSDQCASSRCDDAACLASGEIGEMCAFHEDCASDVCNGAFSPPGVCAPHGMFTNGMSCAERRECASDACAAGICTQPICFELGPAWGGPL